MSRTSKALKRLGVAGVVAATIGAGVPAFIATPASAAATGITLTPDNDSAPVGTCNQFTATVTFDNSNGADTATVDVQAVPRAANQDVDFCSLSNDGTTSQAPTGTSTATGGAGQTEKREYVATTTAGSNTATVTFGIISAQAGVIDVTAFLEGLTGSTGTANNTPDGNEPRDTSVKTFTTGGAGVVTALDAEPETQILVQGGTATFTAKVTQSDGQPVPGVAPEFRITSGPDAALTAAAPINCSASDQTGTSTCQFTNTGGPGTDNVTVYLDQDNDNVVDTSEPQDQIVVNFQAPQQAGTTVELTCTSVRTNTAGDQCANPLSEKTEVFTATVKNSAGAVVAGAAVQFAITGQTNDTSPNGGAGTTASPDVESLSPTSCQTDANGQCSTTVTNPTPTQNETVTVRARIVTGPGSTNVDDTATKTWRSPTPEEARNITLAPKTQNTAIPGVATVVATVTDRLGQPVSNVEVTFTENGPGAFRNGGSTFTAVTGADGKASAELQSVVGEPAGTNTVTATISGFRQTNGAIDPRGSLTTDDECEQAATGTTSGFGNAPGQTAGNCSDTATVTFGGTPSPSAPGGRRALTLVVNTPLIPAGSTGRLTATGAANEAYQLMCYTRPSTTFVLARSGTFNAAGDPVTFTLSLGRNTRCFIQYATTPTQGASPSVVINVRTVLSLSTVRTGVRTYIFQGRNLPRVAGQLITLYRVDAAGNEIRTSNLVTDSSGIYRVTRKFTGTGTFLFRVRTSQTLNNAAGVSNTITVRVF